MAGIILFFLLLLSVDMHAGQSMPTDSIGAFATYEDLLQSIADESDADDTFIDEELVDQLETLHASPLNINSATADDLSVLPFIDPTKAADIVAYRDKNGAFYSLGELMFIPSLSKTDRDLLRLFVTVVPPAPYSPLFSAPSHDIMWRTDIPLYTKAGFLSPAEGSAASGYLGDRYRHSLRYTLAAGRHIAAGVSAEKDAGERGVDYWSAYAMLRDVDLSERVSIRRAIVGNYRISLGQGLVMNTSSRYGKMMTVGGAGRIDRGITPHRSTAESGYLTGAAATVQWGRMLFTALASHRLADGTMRNDSAGISTIVTDGLHRTPAERAKHGNLAVTDLGGNIHWGNDHAQLSATLVSTRLSVPLMPVCDTPSTLYRLYNARGDEFLCGSVAYLWHNAYLSISGETAFSDHHSAASPQSTAEAHGPHLATLHTVQWHADARNTFTAIGRWYGAQFVSINGKAFGENSSVQNEEGLLLGWRHTPSRALSFTTYADMMYFPWLKYQVGAASHGVEALVQMDYTPRAQPWSLMVRYRVKSKEKDTSAADGSQHSTLQYHTKHHAKAQLRYALSPSLSLGTTAVAVFAPSPSMSSSMSSSSSSETGYAISQSVRWTQPNGKSKIDFGMTYFHTDSYDTRVTLYEPSLPYTFGFSSMQYHGLRATLLATAPLWHGRMALTAKMAHTYYFDRDSIGTGRELIDACHREDIQIAVRFLLGRHPSLKRF